MQDQNHQLSKVPEYATAANAAHQRCTRAANETLDHARVAGELLSLAREALPHGEFTRWVERECEFGTRMARRYMAVHENWSVIEEKRTRAAVLSIRDAEDLLKARCIPCPKPGRAVTGRSPGDVTIRIDGSQHAGFVYVTTERPDGRGGVDAEFSRRAVPFAFWSEHVLGRKFHLDDIEWADGDEEAWPHGCRHLYTFDGDFRQRVYDHRGEHIGWEQVPPLDAEYHRQLSPLSRLSAESEAEAGA